VNYIEKKKKKYIDVDRGIALIHTNINVNNVDTSSIYTSKCINYNVTYLYSIHGFKKYL